MRDYKGEKIDVFPSSYVVIDIETTGLDSAYNSIIELAALKIENFNVIDSFSSLVNPGVPIDSFITELTGIRNEQLSTAPTIDAILPSFDAFVSDSIVVGHNVSFDINFIYDNFEKFLFKPFSNDYINTLSLSRKYYKSAPSYKLSALKTYLDINVEVSHRALADCHATNILYQKLYTLSLESIQTELKLVDQLDFDETNPFYHKLCAFKGTPQFYSYSFIDSIMKKCQAKFSTTFYQKCDYIIFGNYTYEKFLHGKEISLKFEKAKKLVAAGTLTIISENELYNMLNIPMPDTTYKRMHDKIAAQSTVFDETHPLYGKVCCFTGTLGSMQRKDAMQLVVDLGGSCSNTVTKQTNYLILGNTDYCSNMTGEKTGKTLKAEKAKLAGQDIEIISENVFLDMVNQ